MVCSAYFDDQRDFPVECLAVMDYCVNFGMQLVLGCDTNAHNKVWGSVNDNDRGERLLEILLRKDLVAVNVGDEPTWVTRVSRQVLDLTIAIEWVASRVRNWKVSDEETGLDHRMICFELQIPELEDKKYRNPKSTDWEFYRSLLEDRTKRFDFKQIRTSVLWNRIRLHVLGKVSLQIVVCRGGMID